MSAAAISPTDAAIVDVMARSADGDVFSSNADVAQRTAIPYKVEAAREMIQGRMLTVLTALRSAGYVVARPVADEELRQAIRLALWNDGMGGPITRRITDAILPLIAAREAAPQKHIADCELTIRLAHAGIESLKADLAEARDKALEDAAKVAKQLAEEASGAERRRGFEPSTASTALHRYHCENIADAIRALKARPEPGV